MQKRETIVHVCVHISIRPLLNNIKDATARKLNCKRSNTLFFSPIIMNDKSVDVNE
jgi:hypothetical protein